MGRYGQAYEASRRSVTELVSGLDAEALARRVPATRDWSVQDVVAHLVGIVSDAVSGNVEGTGTDAWTQAQVSARRGLSLEEVIAEWEQKSPGLEASVDAFPPAVGGGLVQDAWTHEQDIRHALGSPGARDGEPARIALEFNLERLRRRIAKHGLPPLRVRAGEIDEVLGEGEPQATLTADPFELARATGGRRTLDEIRALGWDADPAPWLDHLSMYGIPAGSLGE